MFTTKFSKVKPSIPLLKYGTEFFEKNVDKEKSVHGIVYTLDLIASLYNETGSEDIGCGDDEEEEDKQKGHGDEAWEMIVCVQFGF